MHMYMHMHMHFNDKLPFTVLSSGFHKKIY